MLNFLYKLLYDIFFFQIKMTMYVRVLFIGQYFPLHSFIHVTSLSVRRRSDGIEPHLLAAIMQLSTLQLSIFKSEKERKRQKKIGEHACADLRGGGGLQICLGPDDYSLVYCTACTFRINCKTQCATVEAQVIRTCIQCYMQHQYCIHFIIKQKNPTFEENGILIIKYDKT